ncbi:MAG: thioredoxin domain-containing protein [Acidobacteriaceae bacterium]|nr:thioredoxin domain-containing protein [Acidobacteriaceae bacterium]
MPKSKLYKARLHKTILLLLLAIAACSLTGTVSAAQPEPPKLDKQRLETYLRYAEGFTPGVKFAIDDPTPSPFKGYYRVLVHLSTEQTKVDRVYYVAPDGRNFINGSIWNLDANPFLDTLQHLPTTGPSFGPANAKVTLVIFSDFECPYCRAFAKTVRDNISQKYPNDVRVVYKDFPIPSIHPWAFAAAEAGQCIAAQKSEAFWLFHDWIFQHQQEINPTNLREKTLGFAKDQKLDTGKIGTCIDTHAMADQVNQSLKAGEALQIQQTPTSFVNGRQLSGAVEWGTLDSVIKVELNRPASVPGPTSEKCCEVSMPTAMKH